MPCVKKLRRGSFGSTRAVAPRRPAMAADELHKFDPEKHKHRRVWVAVAATLLALQAALAVRFVQVSVRQEKQRNLDDEDFDFLGVVCNVAASTATSGGYAYYFAVPGLSKTIEADDDDPTPDKKAIGELSGCWAPKKTVDETFDCGDDADCYKIFDPDDDLKHAGKHWFFFRAIGLFFGAVALFFTVFLVAFFAFVSGGFRAAPEGGGDDAEVELHKGAPEAEV
ncbi:hypothetical protein JL722_6953 [Aureococcus anophagefferens]|nr:hypothetical protein JL722_6953 [Aureococcus anophagefferens]